MVRMQVNVPDQIRREARSASRSTSRQTSSKVTPVALISEYEVHKAAKTLESSDLRAMEDKFRERLDERIESIQESPYLSDPVKRDLKGMARKYKEAAKYAEQPSGNYLVFSSKIRGFAKEFKDYLKHLGQALKEKDV